MTAADFPTSAWQPIPWCFCVAAATLLGNRLCRDPSRSWRIVRVPKLRFERVCLAGGQDPKNRKWKIRTAKKKLLLFFRSVSFSEKTTTVATGEKRPETGKTYLRFAGPLLAEWNLGNFRNFTCSSRKKKPKITPNGRKLLFS